MVLSIMNYNQLIRIFSKCFKHFVIKISNYNIDNMQNLRRKPTFNELINYLEIKQPKIRYPDRTATFIRNSHYLSQFDGNLFDMEEQQKKSQKNK